MAGALAGAGIMWQTPANSLEPHDYIFREGRRYVRPYYFEFISHIRVHLKHIGDPIGNDELYLSGKFCPRSSKGTSISRASSPACSLPSSDPESSADLATKDTEADEEFGLDPMCTNCPNLAPVGSDGDEEGLWLHCV